VKVWGIAGLAWCVGVAPALGGSFDDFNKGVAARNRGDTDASIQYLSAAITAGDLLPSLQPIAYLDRAYAYVRKNQKAPAIADLSAAIKLDPKLAAAYEARATLYAADGHVELALDDCSMAVSQDPTSPGAHAQCGRLHWQTEHFDLAAREFGQAAGLDAQARDDQQTYDMLWLKLSRLKAGEPDDSKFTQDVRSIDMDAWPAPILELYLGETSPEAVRLAAAKGDADTQKNQACEVGFYVGEWQLIRRDLSGATSLLQQAVDLCPTYFIERGPAVSELRKIK
jgi:lipoprotein NlpI